MPKMGIAEFVEIAQEDTSFIGYPMP